MKKARKTDLQPMNVPSFFKKIATWMRGLSFRTGLLVGAACIVCYILSFAQMFLPLSLTTKGVLWTVFFGMAKALQYSALLILGKEGVRRMRRFFAR